MKETPLTKQDDVCTIQNLLTVTVFIGSPPQQLELLVDIVNPYIQVDEKRCRSCSAPNRFSLSNSRTFAYERIIEIDGEEATLGQDNVMLGPEKKLQVFNQTIVVMTNRNPSDYKGFDGLFVPLYIGSRQGNTFPWRFKHSRKPSI